MWWYFRIVTVNGSSNPTAQQKSSFLLHSSAWKLSVLMIMCLCMMVLHLKLHYLAALVVGHVLQWLQHHLAACYCFYTGKSAFLIIELVQICLCSDTNYVLDGFRAEYTISACPGNCSGRGFCIKGRCVCNGAEWGGADCSRMLCPKGISIYS